MKQYLLLASILVIGVGCGYDDVKVVNQNNGSLPTIEGKDIQVVDIDGCQYLTLRYERSLVLTHKGNCHNPVHQTK